MSAIVDSKDNPATPKNEGLLEPRVMARTGQHATADSDFDTLPGSSGSGDTVNDFIHHNSLRPDADEFQSRPTAELDAPGLHPARWSSSPRRTSGAETRS